MLSKKYIKNVLRRNFYGRYLLGFVRSFRHAGLLAHSYNEYMNESFSPITLPNGNKMFLYDSDEKSRHYKDLTAFDDILNKIWRDVIRDSDFIFDMGANYGQFIFGGIDSFDKYTSTKVFAFEPNPKIKKALIEAVEVNGLSESVVVEQYGVSDENGRSYFFINLHSSGGSSIKSINAFNPMQGIYRKRINIDLIRLDEYVQMNGLDLIDKHVAIKIDVEGHDFEALIGALPVLKSTRLWFVIMETTRQDAMRIYKMKEREIIELFDDNFLHVTYGNMIYAVTTFDEYLKHFDLASGCIDVVISNSNLDILAYLNEGL